MKFQNPSIHDSKVNTQTDRQTDTQTDKPKAICPSNFFKVGGIKQQDLVPMTYASLFFELRKLAHAIYSDFFQKQKLKIQ